MAYILRISATVSYTDNSVGSVSIVVDEFGNVLTNDSSNHPIDISNIKTFTNDFDEFPVPALLDFLDLNVVNGAKEVSSIVMGVLVINDREQCYILYDNGAWDIYGDIDVALNLFNNNSDSIGEALNTASLSIAPSWQLVINNNITVSLTPGQQKVMSETNPNHNFPVYLRVINNLDDSPINVESVQEISDPDDNYTLVSGGTQVIGPNDFGNIVLESGFDAGTHLGQYVVTINGQPFTLLFGITLSDSGGER